MKEIFLSVILIEGDAQEKRVEEMESCGMEALSRAVASSVRISVGVDGSGVLNWMHKWGCVLGLMTVDWLEEGRFLLWEAVGGVEGFGLVMES